MNQPATPVSHRAAEPRKSRPRATTKRVAKVPSLHRGVLVMLRDLIVHNELPPGARLTERVLCERFKVSRTPLREALKVLANEGLVELLPNCGGRVNGLTAAEARHLFEVMGALEALAGRLACAHVTDAEVARIQALHREMQARYEQRDLPAYFDLNQEIHERIVAAARNPVLAASHAALNARLRRARYLASLQDEARWAAAMDEHEQFTDALARRAGAEMGVLLQQHLEHKCKAVCAQLAGRGHDAGRRA